MLALTIGLIISLIFIIILGLQVVNLSNQNEVLNYQLELHKYSAKTWQTAVNNCVDATAKLKKENADLNKELVRYKLAYKPEPKEIIILNIQKKLLPVVGAENVKRLLIAESVKELATHIKHYVTQKEKQDVDGTIILDFTLELLKPLE